MASVVRPMSVIGRFSIMPSWKDDGQIRSNADRGGGVHENAAADKTTLA
jgi:hypothetical protein